MNSEEYSQLRRKAEAWAEQSAPFPKTSPEHAGLIGFGIAALVIAIFTGFARLDTDQFGIPLVLTVAIGFAIPYFYGRSEQKKHFKAVQEFIDLHRPRSETK
jgi:hypothetical protein